MGLLLHTVVLEGAGWGRGGQGRLQEALRFIVYMAGGHRRAGGFVCEVGCGGVVGKQMGPTCQVGHCSCARMLPAISPPPGVTSPATRCCSPGRRETTFDADRLIDLLGSFETYIFHATSARGDMDADLQQQPQQQQPQPGSLAHSRTSTMPDLAPAPALPSPSGRAPGFPTGGGGGSSDPASQLAGLVLTGLAAPLMALGPFGLSVAAAAGGGAGSPGSTALGPPQDAQTREALRWLVLSAAADCLVQLPSPGCQLLRQPLLRPPWRPAEHCLSPFHSGGAQASLASVVHHASAPQRPTACL